ncbi:hypothetical protein [Nonomuraea sp. NPDC050540]|uniref:hypothetical protein n=1 Tax=Nonomuraea sp. NPDC050540 TaxID=3364367 RepID=UPI0037A56FCE
MRTLSPKLAAEQDTTMHLRPDLIIRCGNAFAGLVAPYVVLATVVFFTEDLVVPDPVAYSLIVVVALAMPYLAVRGYRMAILCTPASVTVRGWLRNRTIPIQDVADTGGLLSGRLLWLDATGRLRHTPTIAFATLVRAPSSIKEHNVQAEQRLQDWVARHQTSAAKRRHLTAMARNWPRRTRFLWLGGRLDDVVGWVLIALALTCAGIFAQGLPSEIRAAQGLGRPGTFIAIDRDCGDVTCSWNGSFRSHDGTVVKNDAWLYGTAVEDLQAGDQVAALDTGHAHKMFTPGTHDLVSWPFFVIAVVALGWYGLRRITNARRERLAELAMARKSR